MAKGKQLISREGELPEIAPFYVMEILARAKSLERGGKDVIHLEIGEPDFPTPSAVLEAGIRYLQNGQVKYTPAAGLPELRDAVANYYRSRYQIEVPPHRIFITPGASGAFILALTALRIRDRSVLLSDPGYPCYANFVKVFGGVPRPVVVDAATNFQLNINLVENAWQPNTAGVIISSPGNPTGTRMHPNVLAGLTKWLCGHSGFLISDEIYHGLEYGARSPSAVQFSDDVFVVNSFSKYFGMTGWRLGWLVAPDRYVETIERLAQNLFIAAPSHSQAAALAAFSPDNLQELERRRQCFEARRDLISSELQKLGFRLHAFPDGAFYVWVDCRSFSCDSRDFADRLLAETGVAVTPGLDFGLNDVTGSLRFSYAVSAERIEEGIDRIAAFLQRGGFR